MFSPAAGPALAIVALSALPLLPEVRACRVPLLRTRCRSTRRSRSVRGDPATVAQLGSAGRGNAMPLHPKWRFNRCQPWQLRRPGPWNERDAMA